MTRETALPVEERLRQLLHHLGIRQAHIAGRVPRDWTGLATTSPDLVASLTLICPMALDPQTVTHLASRLLVVTGDQGPQAEGVRQVVERVAGAHLVTLRDYPIFAWTDMVADRTDEIGAAMLSFLARAQPRAGAQSVPSAAEEGEITGLSYRLHGAGPPLVLLPLGLSPSQWDPLVPRLSAHYCTITLGGRELGPVASLESRGHAAGFLAMVRTLLEAVHLRPGESILEVGCGTGVLDRWLAQSTHGTHRITGVDINRYLLREGMALAQHEGLEGVVAFREGNAEALPFPDQSFDVTLSVTVMEEVDAHQMLREMVRVTTPGGRVAVIVRAVDMPCLLHLPLHEALKRKVEAPSGWAGGVGVAGCADASLYQRFHQAGLTQIRMFPQWAAFDSADTTFLQNLLGGLLSTLSQDEAREWQMARAQAEGTFFYAQPHHCAVGTKP